MDPRDHPLFKQYPLNGKAVLSTGEVPTPYHIYDGYGVFIGGTGNLSAVRYLLREENVFPVQTEDEQAVMGIWACDFSAASLGPHHELQLSIFVSQRAAEPPAPQRCGALALMLARPEVGMLCYRLWNNTPTAVAYNRELLGLEAEPATSRIERSPQAIEFSFQEDGTGGLILAGSLNRPRQASIGRRLKGY